MPTTDRYQYFTGYFAGALNPKALKQFFVDVAEASPIPVRPITVTLCLPMRIADTYFLADHCVQLYVPLCAMLNRPLSADRSSEIPQTRERLLALTSTVT